MLDVMEGNNANRGQILGQINSSAARTICLVAVTYVANTSIT